jgi:hypothetical protein
MSAAPHPHAVDAPPAAQGRVARTLWRGLRGLALAIGIVLLLVSSSAVTLALALRYLGPGHLADLRELVAAPATLTERAAPTPLPEVRTHLLPTPHERALPTPATAPDAAPLPFGVAPTPIATDGTWLAALAADLERAALVGERDTLALALDDERASSAQLEARVRELEAQLLEAVSAVEPPPALPDVVPPPLPTPSAAPTAAPPAPPPGPSPEQLRAATASAFDALALTISDVAASDPRFAPQHQVTRDELLLLALEGPVSALEHEFDDYSRELTRSLVLIDAPGVLGVPAEAVRLLTSALGEPDRTPTLAVGEVLRFEGRTRTATLTVEGEARVRVDVRHEGLAPGSMQVFRADEPAATPTGGLIMLQEAPGGP